MIFPGFLCRRCRRASTVRRFLFCRSRLPSIMDKARPCKVLDLMARLGLAEAQLGKFPHQISGGQRGGWRSPAHWSCDHPSSSPTSLQRAAFGAGRTAQPSRSPESIFLGILLVATILNVIGRVTVASPSFIWARLGRRGRPHRVPQAPHPYTQWLCCRPSG